MVLSYLPQVNYVYNRKSMNLAKKCYMCDMPGATREHVPPLSFFPAGHRMNLITVPSCTEHNSKYSKDVEYVRNVIVQNSGNNSIAMEFLIDKVVRSYERSPKLKQRTFEKRFPYKVQEQDSMIYKVDLLRLSLVMQAVAYAIYFKDFGKSFTGEWLIYNYSIINTKPITEGSPEPVDQGIREALSITHFTQMQTTNPKVFKYAIHEGSESIFYKFEFYEGFIAYALGSN